MSYIYQSSYTGCFENKNHMTKKSLKIAHISDLHFSKILFSPTQFFSKRWIGNLNVILNRRKIHLNEKPLEFIPFLQKHNFTHVFISGDLSTTSYRKEFLIAKHYIEKIENLGIKVFIIPGNHDCYLKHTEKKKIFYRYFDKNLENLKKEKVLKIALQEGLWLILLDTCQPCPFYLSQGLYSLKQDILLRETLSSIAPHEKIIIMNHFPLFQYESKRRSLKGAALLQNTIKNFQNVIMYCHGHTHKNTIADLTASSYPLILDSGSLSHRDLSSFNSIDIFNNKIIVQAFKYHSKNTWEPFKMVQKNL